MGPGHRLAACSVVALSALLPLSYAAEAFRWVDDEGRTHISDKVPEKYRHSATRVDTGPEPSPRQRREAQERAAEYKKRAEETVPRSGDTRDSTVPVPPAAPIQSTPRTTRNASDCAELLRRYRESQECFAPFRMANGGLRPEAFQLCGPDLPDPSGQCTRVDPAE